MSEPTPMETACGKGSVVLSTGRTVSIRQIPIDEYTELLQAQGDEVKIIRMYVPEIETKILSPADAELIVKEGDRINVDFFGAWLDRRMSRLKRINPALHARLISGNIAPTAL